MEERSRSLDRATLRDAIANWKLIGDRAEQLALVRENAQARRAELTLAYRNVVHVSSGFRKRRGRSGTERLGDEPCIVFVVRRKWETGAGRPADPQRLPERLLAWATVNGKRVLCALPTDVQAETGLHGLRPRGARLTWTRDAKHPAMGSLACAVELSGTGQPEVLVLSALHVFSPRPKVNPPAPSRSLDVLPIAPDGMPLEEPLLLKTIDYAGALRDAESGLSSFDVQLARIQAASRPRLRAMLADMKLSVEQPYVIDAAMLERLATRDFFELEVPDNHPDRPRTPRPRMVCEFSQWLDFTPAIPYKVREGTAAKVCQAVHQVLVEMKVRGPHRPLRGDSGCAVVFRHQDGRCTLAGLFIASHDSLPYAYVIPAWQLFDTTAYFRLPEGTGLRPVDP